MESGGRVWSAAFPAVLDGMLCLGVTCLLLEAVSHTPITAWKWLGKYFERQKLLRNHCCVSHVHGKRWTDKFSLASHLLTIPCPGSTAPFPPSFSYLLAFKPCCSKIPNWDGGREKKKIKFLMSINTSKVERTCMPAPSLELTFTALQ